MRENIFCSFINQSISTEILSRELYSFLEKINPNNQIKKIDIKKTIFLPFKNRNAIIFISFPFYKYTIIACIISCISKLFKSNIKFNIFTRGAIIQSNNFFIYSVKLIFWQLYGILSNFIEIQLFCSSYYEIYRISSGIFITNNLKYNLIYDHKTSYDYLNLDNYKSNSKPNKNNIIKILLASRYSWDKGINETLYLLSKLSPENLDQLEIMIVGCKLNINSKFPILSNRTRFIEFTKREKILMEMTKADIFLAPSVSESYGWTVIEALQMGCKVIVTSSSPWAFTGENKYIKPINPLLENIKPKDFFKLIKQLNKTSRKKISFNNAVKIIENSDSNWKRFIKENLTINY
tara:strand:+ start:4500 stop:5549 length:1050 start_codon:yes stop_codon:yes gene_type:complete